MLCLQGLRLKAAGQLVGSFPGGTVVRFGPVAAEDRLGPLGKRGGIGAGILEGPDGFFHAGWRRPTFADGPEFEPLPVPGESDAESWDGKCQEEKKGRRQTWAKSG
jgi:hypothetical protein